jgi:SAM-dependent methyltransferase
MRSSLFFVAAIAAASCGTQHVELPREPTDPPIDCPLRQQGIDPDALRPFDEVEEYIAFLERPDRAAWQRPDVVVEALGLVGTETVADVGAGSGYFTFRIAEALPEGKVLAIDVDPEMVRHLHHKATTMGVENVEVVLAANDDPQVTRETDMVFICDVLHHVRQREAWLQRLHSEMRPGARVVLIEFKEGELPEGPPESVKIDRRAMIALMEEAGFRLSAERPDLLPYQHFLVFDLAGGSSTTDRPTGRG